MRTHLLHTVPAAAPDANCGNGVATNDECYAPNPPVPRLTIASGFSAEQLDVAVTNHDHYYLDGYAGI